ncbi:phosphodiester glycosidase family protein [Streptomyces sp. F63]|uniref:phosphodiester glycosidase family protein n=1 Tax=Streptomyces sp. F63 TaxID=2824887 RepID=UPI001B386CC8|nr:phosphodiester glycosidase family protein [Streptomyces sp. F63]MBQ0984506.1 phosphodiester glycosidase family protein [Streptomyces sp. F63]
MPFAAFRTGGHRRRRRPGERRGAAAVLVTTAALLLGGVPPATATASASATTTASASDTTTASASDTDPRPVSPAGVLRPVAPPPARGPSGGAAATAGAREAAGAEAVEAVETARSTRPVAPGVELTSFDRLTPGKWLRADALTVDLTGGARVDYLSPGEVSRRATVSEQVAAHDPGPGRRTVAAINADFFDIDATGAPLGPGIREGRLTHSGTADHHVVAGFGPGAAGRILGLYFDGTVTLPGGSRALGAYNAARVPEDGIGLYTPQWGGADRALTVPGAERVTEVVLVDGRVRSAGDGPGSGPVPDGTTVLLGRDAGADALAALRPGDPVDVAYAPRTDGGPVPRTAVGSRGLLVVDGEPQNWEGRPNNATAPRTAVGFSRDGSTLHVLTLDGRQADSGGVTLTELALMMKELGAHNALNLDGGGSSTLLARQPGAARPRVENSPSDGAERPVPNGLAVTAPAGSGRTTGFRVETATTPESAPTTGPVLGGRPDRVFPGLTRALRATGHDETYGPAAGRPHWHVRSGGAGRVDGHGVFTARRPGRAEVSARLGGARGSVGLEVIGPLRRIVPTTPRVGLADSAATGTFGLTGLDAHGSEAPVEPADVRLEYDRSRFSVTPDGRGSFTVAARAGGGSGRIEATVRGRTAVIGVTVGLEERRIAGFDDAGDWTFSQARAAGSVAPDPGGREGTGLRLSYDFTRSTATRAAYANPPARIPVTGQPQSFRLWIKGDGKGAWPSLHLVDAQDTSLVLRGPFITWSGWREVEFAVPPGTVHPLRVRRFYVAETDPLKQYTGEIVIDGLTARVPPDIELPAAEPVPDRLIAGAAETGRRDWRFAVLSDAQFTAREPDGPLVRQTRRTLREIRASRPGLLLVNGDLVDEGSPPDLALARRVLEEELGGAVPWVYVPGNHEVMGGSIDLFEEEFGPGHRVFDHRGTRFITLDTSRLTVRGGGLAQVRALRAELERAAADPGTGSVIVVQHVPPRDPTPQRASELADRKEAALLEHWLADFRRTSGKGAAVIGAHAGVFHASRVDGVPYLVNGNSGKAPAAPPGRGGFSGWSTVGVDRVTQAEQARARQRPWEGGPDWISVRTRPHVDGLRLDGPAALPAGETARITAAVTQGEGSAAREVPVGFPVSADWTGSPNLRIGSPDGARPRHAAAYDPVTGTFTALRPATVVLAVSVNGVTERRELRIAARAPAAGTGSGAAAAGAG